MLIRIASFILISTALMVPQLKAQDPLADAYFNLGIGGDFAGGDAYHNRDPRFLMQIEGGNQFMAIPISISFGQSITVTGIKPRVQYFVSPFKQFPNLAIAPGVGATFNWWHETESGLTINVYEFGPNISGHIRYKINESLDIMWTPIFMDFLPWRHLSASYQGQSASTSNSSFGFVYSTIFSVGMIF